MDISFIKEHVHSTGDFVFFWKCGLISLEAAKEWILFQIKLGNDQFIDFVWIQHNLQKMIEATLFL